MEFGFNDRYFVNYKVSSVVETFGKRFEILRKCSNDSNNMIIMVDRIIMETLKPLIRTVVENGIENTFKGDTLLFHKVYFYIRNIL